MKTSIYILMLFITSIFYSCRLDLDWREDEQTNNTFQPPEEVMDIIGVKEGMVIGEVGAAYGRFTIPLAKRVGEEGCVYANDIEKTALSFLIKRSNKAGLKNIKTILGTYDDPCFPIGELDIAFASLVYHEIGNPVIFLKNLIPALKPDAPIVIVDYNPEINKEKSNIGRNWEKEFEDAGLEIVKKERLHERDILYILKVKTQ